ncbi:MAG: hypothetical protein KF819_09780 [Labilithrix sp.]|nr:hypothetical protein [Labilithrix sp.]
MSREPDNDEGLEALVRRHLRAGFWGLTAYIALGALLEIFHAFKVASYLDVGRETTRLLLRLAHAHGTLLSLVNVVFALTARARPEAVSRFASAALLSALVLLPAGFLLGGIWAHDGDPGIGIVLVPAGALAAALGAGLVAAKS